MRNDVSIQESDNQWFMNNKFFNQTLGMNAIVIRDEQIKMFNMPHPLPIEL